MSKISVGDLVVVVRACCDEYVETDWIFRVGAIYRDDESGVCAFCRTKIPGCLFAGSDEEEVGVPTSWLKRIPPLEELEGEKTQEDIREPA